MTAFETGTATDATDLYGKLETFLTTHVDLVAASEQWVLDWNTPGPGENATGKVLVGPGLAGTDQVYVGMALTTNAVDDIHHIAFRGMTGTLPGGLNYHDHVNSSPADVRMFLDSNPMTYWFVANGRRFVLVVKMSTVYEACYCGMFLPYTVPTAYPYPIFIGGSAGPADADGPLDWRSVNANHTLFFSPHYDSFPAVEASAHVLGPDGSWGRVANHGDEHLTTYNLGPEYTDWDYFQPTGSGIARYNVQDILRTQIDAFGGDQAIIPLTIIQRDPQSATMGILDGVHICQGSGNASENLISVGGVDHMVVQNAFRTATEEYWTIELE